jgi:5-methylcytosine-specific restriction endonuclease McrBC regulatory subunit McrC
VDRDPSSRGDESSEARGRPTCGWRDVRTNMALRHRNVCRYTELTSDVRMNQTLCYATSLLGRFAHASADIEHQLAWSLLHLSDVPPTAVTAREAGDFAFGRLNAHYRTPTALARLIIDNVIFRHEPGQAAGPGFLQDMNRVLEEFLGELVHRRAASHELAAQTARRPVPRSGIAGTNRADILLRDSSRSIRVAIDAKFKRENPGANVYQALAYCKGAGPAGRRVGVSRGRCEPPTYQVRNNDPAILIRTVSVGRGQQAFDALDTRSARVVDELLGELKDWASGSAAA